MSVLRETTTRQRRSLVISLLWLAFGLYMLTQTRWMGIAYIAIAVVSAAGTWWDVHRSRVRGAPSPPEES
jgi:hypothetical protein